jgi:chromate reductase
MKTLGTRYTDETTVLISGVKSKINTDGEITDIATQHQIEKLIEAIREQIQ